MYVCVNTILRHSVNRAVAGRITDNDEEFKAFVKLVHSATFKDDLEKAKEDPKGEAARRVVEKVLRYVRLPGSRVAWSNEERATELGKFINEARGAGDAVTFYSHVFDDVHDVNAVRLGFPFRRHDVFPALGAAETPGILSQLNPVPGTDLSGVRPQLKYDNLQALAARNPVATAQAFEFETRIVDRALFQVDDRAKKDVPLEKRRKGIYGVPVVNRHVTECNQKASMHIHGSLRGGLSPKFIGDVIHHERLRKVVLECVDFMDFMFTG